MQNVKPIADTKFPIGYNDKLKPSDLPSGFCALIQNGFLDYKKLRERYGYTLEGTDTGEGKPNLMLHSHEVGTTKQLIKINNNATDTAANLFYKNPTDVGWTKVTTSTFTAGQRVCACTAMGKTYLSNGVDSVYSWNGTTLTAVAAMPKTKYLYFFHNHLWALNSSSYKSRAYFSNPLDVETFQPDNLFDINPDDGDEIIGATSMKDEFIVGKLLTMYSFQGWSEETFSASAVNDNISGYGITSHWSCVNIGNDVLFGSLMGPIPAIRSISQTQFATTVYGGILTDDIEGTMRSANNSQMGKVSAVYDGKFVWFFYPTGSNAFNDGCLTFDPITKGFAKHTGIYAANVIRSRYSGSTKIYFADSRNSKVYVFDESNSDNGVAIDFQFISRRYTPDFKRPMKFKYVYTQWEMVGGLGEFSVQTSVDEAGFDTVDTLSCAVVGQSVFSMAFPFQFGATTMNLRRTDLPYGGLHHNIQLKYAKNDTTTRGIIVHYELEGYAKALRDTKSQNPGQ